jgi:hypothetical protein
MRMPINSKRGKRRFQLKKDTAIAKSQHQKNRASCLLVCLG